MKDIANLLATTTWSHSPMHNVQGLTLHYASGSPINPKYDTENQLITLLNSYAKYHIHHLGNDGIAYTFCVDKWGNQYRLRDDKVSWHTGNWWGNYHTLGILLPLGTYESPTNTQVQGMYTLLDSLRLTYGIMKGDIYGHKELRSTDCPGKVYPYILKYRTNNFIPGWYSVVEGGIATIRREPYISDNIIMHLPSGYREYIHAKVTGQYVAQSDEWYKTISTYGEGYIHRSGLSL